MDSDYLPSLLITKNYISLTFRMKICTRPRMNLGKCDKKFFIYVVEEKIKNFSSDSDKSQLLDLWYNIIIDSTLIAGAVIYDGKNNMKRFNNGKISLVPEI